MIRAVPYIYTNGYEPYKQFLLKGFNIEYFCLEDNEPFTLVNQELTINNRTMFKLLDIVTVNDFVNNTYQLGIEIFWNNDVEIMFEPKHIIETDKIKLHYWNLLHGIEKSHELL